MEEDRMGVIPIHILVATDGSATAGEAVRFGAAFAKALGGGLTLLHVVPKHGHLGPSVHDEACRPEERRAAEALLRAAQAEAAQWGSPAAIRIAVGEPVEAIVRTAREARADMLVVGTRGRERMARVLLGSVAENLAKVAPCPVVVVRKVDLEAGGDAPLLAPTDFSDGATQAVRAAALLARRLGVRLALLHILPEAVPAKGEEDPAARRRLDLLLRREAEKKLRDLIVTLDLDPGQVDLHLITGVDADQIVKTAKQIHAGCIVMGTRGLTGLPRVLLGSVTGQVLRRAPCPVMVVPPRRGLDRGWWVQRTSCGSPAGRRPCGG